MLLSGERPGLSKISILDLPEWDKKLQEEKRPVPSDLLNLKERSLWDDWFVVRRLTVLLRRRSRLRDLLEPCGAANPPGDNDGYLGA